jgi:tight adherence protein C
VTYLGGLALGMVVHEGVRGRMSARGAVGVGVSAALIAAVPSSVVIVVAAWVGALLWARRSRVDQTGYRHGPDQLGQVLYIALSAGLPVATALEFAAGEIDAAEATQVHSVLRKARSQGLAAALTGVEGRAGSLFGVLARAQLTGSSAIKAVAQFVDEERKDRRARAAEAAQRLPVKLTVPLALLILPGFVLLTVGPTVVSIFQRLLGPLLL